MADADKILRQDKSEKNERFEKSTEKDKREAPSQDILRRAYEYTVTGKDFDPMTDLRWKGRIQLSKTVRVRYTNQDTNQPEILQLEGGKPFDVDMLLLQQLVRRSFQEGPETDKWLPYEFWDTTKTRIKDPLKISVLQEYVMANYEVVTPSMGPDLT